MVTFPSRATAFVRISVATRADGQARSRPPPATIKRERNRGRARGNEAGANAAAEEGESMGIRQGWSSEKTGPTMGAKGPIGLYLV